MNMLFRAGVIVGLSAIWCRAVEQTVLPIQPTEDRPLAERFANPPPSARILRMLHSQKDKPSEQDKILQQLVLNCIS